MGEQLIQGSILMVLLITAVQDLRKRTIAGWILILGALIVFGCILFCSPERLPDRFLGASIGLTVVVISKLTGGKIGMGDAILLMLSGLGLGFWTNLELFAVALFLASILSVVLLTLRLANRKTRMPFVPFLLAGYLLVILAGPLV